MNDLRLPIPPPTHVYRIGCDCTAEGFCEWMTGKWPLGGPFTKTYCSGLEPMVDLICSRGEHALDFNDLFLAEYKNPWNPCVRNHRTGQNFPHDWFPQACADWNAIRRSYPAVKQKMMQAYDSMCTALDDPKARVLFIYTGYGNLYTEVHGYPAVLDGSPWYSLEVAKRCADKLCKSFKSKITLLYFDVPEAKSARENKITYVRPNLIAGTHIFGPYGWGWLRACVLAVAFAPSLRPILGDWSFPKLPCEPEACLLPTKTPWWQDILYVNTTTHTGYKCVDKDAFDVLEFTENKLEVKWKRWSTEGFARVTSDDFPIWKRYA